jgi:hypothetical protein
MNMETPSREPQAVDYFNDGLDHRNAGQYDDSIAAFEKVIALEPTGRFADLARTFISKSPKTN